MNTTPEKYLTQKQMLQKYPWLTANMLKNILFKDIGGFRGKVLRKIGKRNLFDEDALLRFVAESKGN
jgi:hypothetical protein